MTLSSTKDNGFIFECLLHTSKIGIALKIPFLYLKLLDKITLELSQAIYFFSNLFQNSTAWMVTSFSRLSRHLKSQARQNSWILGTTRVLNFFSILTHSLFLFIYLFIFFL